MEVDKSGNVCHRICNTELPCLNFEWPQLETTTTLASIQKAIRKHHGSAVNKVVLFLERVSDLTNFGATSTHYVTEVNTWHQFQNTIRRTSWLSELDCSKYSCYVAEFCRSNAIQLAINWERTLC